MKRSKLDEDAAAQQPVVQFAAPSWPSVVLVCRECSKRRSGPRKLEGKTVASVLKSSLRGKTPPTPRPRLLLTSCLGLCPKRAIAVAVAGGALGTQIAAVQSLSQLVQMAWVAGLSPLAVKHAEDLEADGQ